MFSIINNGQSIKMTTYWTSVQAKAGYFYLSQNAGALRLLVPDAQSQCLPEISTGRSVTIERSIVTRGCFDIVFEDGTDTPYSITLSPGLMNCKLSKASSIPFTVWSSSGLLETFTAKVKV